MKEAEIAREILGLVPSWYPAQCGPQRYVLEIGEHQEPFYRHAALTPSLEQFLARVRAKTKTLDVKRIEISASMIDVLLEDLAIQWLQIHSPNTDWTRIVDYLEQVSRRTHETEPVSLNLLIRAGQGAGDITQPHVQKFFDQLASSPSTFLAVDHRLHFLEYGEVGWSEVTSAESPTFYPEFLHPIYSILAPDDLSVHLTSKGDLILMNPEGLLAARRKRKWKLYDASTFANSLTYCLGHEAVAANLLEVVFDLSFRRRGALLVYDPTHRIRDHIANTESVLLAWRQQAGLEPDIESGQSLVASSVGNLALGKRVGAVQRKRRLIELAKVDGALVFDDENLLAVGAIIESHPRAGGQLGARATAARSAYLWGARPVNVSADGDVTVYFKSRSGDDECDAVMEF